MSKFVTDIQSDLYYPLVADKNSLNYCKICWGEPTGRSFSAHLLYTTVTHKNGSNFTNWDHFYETSIARKVKPEKWGGDKKGNLNERTQTNTTRGDHIGSCVSMVTKEADQGWNLVLQQACISCPHPPEVNEWEPQFDLKCE